MVIQKCQMQDKDHIHEGKPRPVLLSMRTRFSLTIARWMDPRLKKFIKTRLKLFAPSRASFNYPAGNTTTPTTAREPLKAGDWVRVRSADEIQSTLNAGGWLRGCKFMPEMSQFCGTDQRVFKTIGQFLNECDYTVRKAKGLVILENNFCQGIAGAGRCDRSCFYFWREEWLEKVERIEKNS